MPQRSDHYATLGVSPDAGQGEIRSAFRKRVRACHPDRVGRLDAELRKLAARKMVSINEAYSVLGDPSERARYDDRRTGPTFGEQLFVARAAAEEFERSVRRAAPGAVPIDTVRGSTLTLRAAAATHTTYWTLLATSRLDRRRLLGYLRHIQSWSGQRTSRRLGGERVFVFAAAVELVETDRLCDLIGRFNALCSRRSRFAEAALIDLVTCQVTPAVATLDEVLERQNQRS